MSNTAVSPRNHFTLYVLSTSILHVLEQTELLYFSDRQRDKSSCHILNQCLNTAMGMNLSLLYFLLIVNL